MKKLYYAAYTYMIVGLISGFYYRELTKLNHFTGDSHQLAPARFPMASIGR
ncbi:DUF2871 family protein [Actinomadura harenae]|uniref:DUF2871 family protein n=1 Tax=Actinomadura harenae TaxID=2483351 RepID=A0A3M2LMX7_9ACTN|nr:DUF2871 family protein [Actinomadura harenae]RMI38200.1 DUF2871 family protein [Actinomadura harenae]